MEAALLALAGKLSGEGRTVYDNIKKVISRMLPTNGGEAGTTAQFAITYLPPLQASFGTAAVSFRDGVPIVAVGVVFFALIEVEKQMRLVLRTRR